MTELHFPSHPARACACAPPLSPSWLCGAAAAAAAKQTRRSLRRCTGRGRAGGSAPAVFSLPFLPPAASSPSQAGAGSSPPLPHPPSPIPPHQLASCRGAAEAVIALTVFALFSREAEPCGSTRTEEGCLWCGQPFWISAGMNARGSFANWVQ